VRFYIDGKKLRKEPLANVRYIEARTEDLTVEHHKQILRGKSRGRTIILTEWLPRGMIPFYPGAKFFKPENLQQTSNRLVLPDCRKHDDIKRIIFPGRSAAEIVDAIKAEAYNP
jgi:hypothetical protein